MPIKVKKPRKINIVRGLILKRIRVIKGLRQRQAAEEFRCDVVTWSRWERGQWPETEQAAGRLGETITYRWGLRSNLFDDPAEFLRMSEGDFLRFVRGEKNRDKASFSTEETGEGIVRGEAEWMYETAPKLWLVAKDPKARQAISRTIEEELLRLNLESKGGFILR